MTEFFAVVESPNIEYTEYIPGNMGHVSRITELKIINGIKSGQCISDFVKKDGEKLEQQMGRSFILLVVVVKHGFNILVARKPEVFANLILCNLIR